MSVQEYLDKHRLSQRIEESVNAAVRAKADDLVLFVVSISTEGFVLYWNTTSGCTSLQDTGHFIFPEGFHPIESNYLRNHLPPAILSINARELLDSTGRPALEVDLSTSRGSFRASTILSGAQTEASQDIGLAAVALVKDTIAPVLLGKDPSEQPEIDKLILSSVGSKVDNLKAHSGATLAVSLAVCKAGAAHTEETLSSHIASLADNDRPRFPVPTFTLGSWNKASMQELTVFPVGADSVAQAVKMGFQTHQCFMELLQERYGDAACTSREGGALTPNISSYPEGLQLAGEAIARAGCTGQMKIGMDAAASELCTEDGMYDLNRRGQEEGRSQKQSAGEILEAYKKLCTEFPLASISGAFGPSNKSSSRDLTDLAVCQVVGDKPLSSDMKTVAQTIENGYCNAVVFQMSEMATVSEAMEAVKAAQKGGLSVIASLDKAETGESALADLAMGLGIGQLKIGLPTGLSGIQMCNQVLMLYVEDAMYVDSPDVVESQFLRIEEEGGGKAAFATEKWM